MQGCRRTPSLVVGVVAVGLMWAGVGTAEAGGVAFQDGDKYLKMGGRIQVQYHGVGKDGGGGDDSLRFRRLRPYIEGSTHPNWRGKFQWDMGEARDGAEINIKDAYLEYRGIDHLNIRVGNAYTPFSRETLTSSKYQQLVERTFVGDHNFGAPDRNLGIHVTGDAAQKTVTWGASVAQADIDPDAKKLDFDTPVDANGDFNEGWMIGARVDYHPFGFLKRSQGDFKGDLKVTVGVGAFHWANDGDQDGLPSKTVTVAVPDGSGGTVDVLTLVPDTDKPAVESVTGLEISGAVRGRGVSVDAQYNHFNAQTVDGTVTRGIYKGGEADLQSAAVEGGYMVLPATLEVVGGYQWQDAKGYDRPWTRSSVGANWFFAGHDAKLQLSYRMGQNLNGDPAADADELFVQAQYVF